MDISINGLLKRVARMVNITVAEGPQDANALPDSVVASTSNGMPKPAGPVATRPSPIPYPPSGGVASSYSTDAFSFADADSTHRPAQHYSGVRLQQGRVQSDDDWNQESTQGSVGNDAQLASVELQNHLQKQQGALQLTSNVSKLLHDTAMALVRKIG